MSSLYVIDYHTATFANSKIVDVLVGGSAPVQYPGGCIVNVPDYLTVRDPVGLYTAQTGLITQKATAMLAAYPGFTRIATDDLLDITDLNLVAAGAYTPKGAFGDRGKCRLRATQTVRTVMQTLTAPAPSTCVIVWEAFETTRTTSTSTSQTALTYTERSPSDLTCNVSFDNGGSWLTATSGGVLTVPVINQGTQLILEFTGTGSLSTPRGLGGWAVIY